MVRKVSASQLRSKLQQAQRKTQQAVDKYNREVKRYNQQVKQAVNEYNREVRTYNSRVRANRQRIKRELAKLSGQPTKKTQYVVYHTSVSSLYEAYTRLEQRAETQSFDPRYNRILDLSEKETANSLEVFNLLSGSEPNSEEASSDQDAMLVDELRKISDDLDSRWQGAVYALNPRNPDAARHFCTSAREIISQILELKAPDADVISLLPSCDRTDQGKPTRRAKLKFLLTRKGMVEDALEEFVEQDMENIVQLFRVFNDGTHGSAGTFSFQQLNSIKKRVEDGIIFLAEVVS
ncbi:MULTISPECIES: hypothetical protein [Cyanophyceae]|uniref:Predicted pPIWI-associating nuclease domain-containing protein n=1 Tax=Leptolyngbya subtilissima DQ-A4 TaxID=2933933 RepID=A0ABV0KCT8_9CYAN|nr:hypothetical protein [Nodosilinea sp. FACHB-141]MBD2115211.1 hypothetical protein [Nodosilinea sp. FACHB-141]